MVPDVIDMTDDDYVAPGTTELTPLVTSGDAGACERRTRRTSSSRRQGDAYRFKVRSLGWNNLIIGGLFNCGEFLDTPSFGNVVDDKLCLFSFEQWQPSVQHSTSCWLSILSDIKHG